MNAPLSTDPGDVSCEPVYPRMSRIGLVAYCALPPLTVFVRVPNEPGRWLLTHRCVVEVECPHCKAQVGEPCHNGRQRYGTGTHADRRTKYRYAKYSKIEKEHKPTLKMSDLEAAGAEYA